MKTIETPVNPRSLLGELADVRVHDGVRALGQHVLEQEGLERVEPLLEHREARGEFQRHRGERNDAPAAS